MIIISIILLSVFVFIAIGAILWVNYDYNKTIAEIEEEHNKRILEILIDGLEKLKAISEERD